MDLLGDIGANDQLISARKENEVLRAKVKELFAQLQVLTFENESLKAEIEMYRQEALANSLNHLSLSRENATMHDNSSNMDTSMKSTVADAHHFVQSGNGVYPNSCHVSIESLHGSANLLACSLSPDDTVLATGGADATIRLCHYGTAYDCVNDAASSSAVVASACIVHCTAPVIAVAFAPKCLSQVLAAASMDGSVTIVLYGTMNASINHRSTLKVESQQCVCKHSKYVRTLAWHNNILASASTDGVVMLHTIERNYAADEEMLCDDTLLKIAKLTSLHLNGAVESLCFVNNTLVCYVRETPHLTCFDLASSDFSIQSKIHLNSSPFDTHVSFCVMDMQCCEYESNSKYLAAATDANRNFLLDMDSGSIVKNFYGHANDGYSQPKIAWNRSGQYVMGNTTEDGCVVVWDVASTSIVERLRLEGGHVPIRDLFVSTASDILVTTSFDKKTNIWFHDERLNDVMNVADSFLSNKASERGIMEYQGSVVMHQI